MNSGFGDNVGVETVAEIYRVDVVAEIGKELANIQLRGLSSRPRSQIHSQEEDATFAKRGDAEGWTKHTIRGRCT
jgi:hypothetical protein